MKKYIFLVIAVILILICVITILPASEPERCAICDSIPMHAPALVNMATGEVGELTVYEPHPFQAGEICYFHAPIQVIFLQTYKFLQSRTYILFKRIQR